MTLIIGILVDDSIVVSENIERHHRGRRSAKRRRDQRAHADRSGRYRDHAGRRRGLSSDRVLARNSRALSLGICARGRDRDADLALHLVHGDAGAGRQLVAAFRRGNRRESSIASAQLFERTRLWYAQSRACRGPCGVRVWSSSFRSAAVIAADHRSFRCMSIGFEFMPPVDRGEVFMQFTYPTGTPLA